MSKRPPRRLRVWSYPWTVERAYTASATAYVKAMEAVVQAETKASLPAIIARRDKVRQDVDDNPNDPGPYLGSTNYGDMVSAMIDRIRSQIISGQRALGLKIKTYADQVNVFNFKQWQLMKADIDRKYGAGSVEAQQKTLAAEKATRAAMSGADIQAVRAAMSVNVLTPESGLAEELAVWEVDNVALIQSIPSEYLPQLQNRIITAVRRGENYTQLAKEIRESYKMPEWRAKLIARDQIGKLNGQLTRIRQEELGISEYFWRGMLDSRERPAHVEREGLEFSYDKPPDDGNPGEPIQCRCWAEPKIDFGTGARK
jgi:SPP1 gp7 family putative phage head morphogenesis protein